jgi:3-deoxy-D-manno-octulosonic-acid transferase
VDAPISTTSWRYRSAFFTVLYAALSPLALLSLAHRLWRRRKGLVGWREKISGDGQSITPGQVLVHGVSLGEVMLMRALVPELEKISGSRCLLSTTTETGQAALAEHFSDHERVLLPFDLPWAVGRFLSRAKPRALVLLELEVWPLLLCACHARGIPVVLVNARVSERSFRGYRRAGALMRPLFRGLRMAIGQNALWTSRLINLGVDKDNAVVGGSMKADMVRRASDAAIDSEARRIGLREQPTLLIASTSASEERALLAGQTAWWIERGWQIVICPRHPERGSEIAALLSEFGLSARRSSLGERVDDARREVIIVDEIGKMAALYGWTARRIGIAIVGGSFGSGRGGQNMLEAAAAGCCTVVGWDTRNFPDAMALLREANGVVDVNAADFHERLRALADDPASREALGRAGQSAWEQGQGATRRIIDALAGILTMERAS